jgi:hypothetical protein
VNFFEGDRLLMLQWLEISSLKLLKNLQQKKRVNAKQLNYNKLALVKMTYGLLRQLYVIH